jgi:hypothetical protein
VEIFCARAGNTTRPLTAVTGLYCSDGLRHTCPKPLIASNPAHLNTLLMFNLRYSEYSGSKYTGCPVCGNRYSGQTETLIPVTETSIYNVFMRQSA